MKLGAPEGEGAACARAPGRTLAGSTSSSPALFVVTNSPRLLIQQLMSHLIHYGMRWENSFLFLTGVTDMKDTERIPWKATQSHPSRLPRSLAEIDAAGPGPADAPCY